MTARRIDPGDRGKSICRCGHTGDGPNSEHDARYAEGHGPCLRCDCPQFTWARYRKESRS